jgi:regulator of protease activity HflC (stomatin/prohibitin superfamily)
MGEKTVGSMIGTAIGWIVLGAVCLCFWGCPHYSVWQQGMAGEAELKRAEQNRRIAVNEAQAKMDAAKLLASAEIERAKGVAAANQIIGEGLKGHEEYLRYLWIMSLEHHGGMTVVYIPTEANLPILEAGRLKVDKKP